MSVRLKCERCGITLMNISDILEGGVIVSERNSEPKGLSRPKGKRGGDGYMSPEQSDTGCHEWRHACRLQPGQHRDEMRTLIRREKVEPLYREALSNGRREILLRPQPF